MAKNVEGFETLDVWQKSRDFANAIYRDDNSYTSSGRKIQSGTSTYVGLQQVSQQTLPKGMEDFITKAMYNSAILPEVRLEEVISHLIIAHDQGYIV